MKQTRSAKGEERKLVNPELTAFLAGGDEKELRGNSGCAFREAIIQTVFAGCWEEHLEYGKYMLSEYRDLVWDVNGTACGEKNVKLKKSVAYTGVSGAENGYNLISITY